MPVRFENLHTGRVVEYTTPEEIAPKNRTYASKDEEARAKRDAAQRERLLNTLRKSSRWSPTDREVERKTARQRANEEREALKRQLEGEVRAEHERALEVERAKAAHTPASTPDPDKGKTSDDTPSEEPTAAQVRAWARENDVDVPAKGKLPEAVVAAYKQAAAEASE